ncbi:hypothetical protein EDD11_009923 [Mortierella claussenii]|nr:hypothetical protein EDD11_009923 [Mortierella claussenii]
MKFSAFILLISAAIATITSAAPVSVQSLNRFNTITNTNVVKRCADCTHKDNTALDMIAKTSADHYAEIAHARLDDLLREIQTVKVTSGEKELPKEKAMLLYTFKSTIEKAKQDVTSEVLAPVIKKTVTADAKLDIPWANKDEVAKKLADLDATLTQMVMERIKTNVNAESLSKDCTERMTNTELAPAPQLAAAEAPKLVQPILEVLAPVEEQAPVVAPEAASEVSTPVEEQAPVVAPKAASEVSTPVEEQAPVVVPETALEAPVPIIEELPAPEAVPEALAPIVEEMPVLEVVAEEAAPVQQEALAPELALEAPAPEFIVKSPASEAAEEPCDEDHAVIDTNTLTDAVLKPSFGVAGTVGSNSAKTDTNTNPHTNPHTNTLADAILKPGLGVTGSIGSSSAKTDTDTNTDANTNPHTNTLADAILEPGLDVVGAIGSNNAETDTNTIASAALKPSTVAGTAGSKFVCKSGCKDAEDAEHVLNLRAHLERNFSSRLGHFYGNEVPSEYRAQRPHLLSGVMKMLKDLKLDSKGHAEDDA